MRKFFRSQNALYRPHDALLRHLRLTNPWRSGESNPAQSQYSKRQPMQASWLCDFPFTATHYRSILLNPPEHSHAPVVRITNHN